MAVLDQPEFAESAGETFSRISAAEEEAGVVLSPFAREIVALWAVSLRFEPTTPEPTSFVDGFNRQDGRDEVFEQLLTVLPSALIDFQQSTPTAIETAPRLVRSVDVFHYLADRGNDMIAQSLFCPFDK